MAEVDAVGAERERDVDAIVDEELRADGDGGVAHAYAEIEERARRERGIAELNGEARARVRREPRDRGDPREERVLAERVAIAQLHDARDVAYDHFFPMASRSSLAASA